MTFDSWFFFLKQVKPAEDQIVCVSVIQPGKTPVKLDKKKSLDCIAIPKEHVWDFIFFLS